MDGKFNVDDFLAEIESQPGPGKGKEENVVAEESVSQEQVFKTRSRRKDVVKKDERGKNSEKACFVLDKDLLSRIKMQAYQENVSFSFLVSRILDKNIKSMEQIIADMKK